MWWISPRVPQPDPSWVQMPTIEGVPPVPASLEVFELNNVEWEYDVTSPLNYITPSGEADDCFDSDHLIYVLGIWGDDGWEIVSVVSPSQWILKRPKRNS